MAFEKSNKRAIFLFFILMLFIISLFPIVEAQRESSSIGGSISKAFDFISDILNAKIKLPNKGYLPYYHRNQTIPLGVFAGVFMIIYSIIFTVTRRIPMFKEEGAKNAAIAFSIAFTLISILASPIVEMAAKMVAVTGELGAVALFVIAIVVIAGLFALTPKAWRWTRGELKDVEREEKELGEDEKLRRKGERGELGEDKVRRDRIALDTEIKNLLNRVIEMLKNPPKEFDNIKNTEWYKSIILIVDEVIKRLKERRKSNLGKLELKIKVIIEKEKKIIEDIENKQKIRITLEDLTSRIINKLIQEEEKLLNVESGTINQLRALETGIDTNTKLVIEQLEGLKEKIATEYAPLVQHEITQIIEEIRNIDMWERAAEEIDRKLILDSEKIKQIIKEIYKELEYKKLKTKKQTITGKKSGKGKRSPYYKSPYSP